MHSFHQTDLTIFPLEILRIKKSSYLQTHLHLWIKSMKGIYQSRDKIIHLIYIYEFNSNLKNSKNEENIFQQTKVLQLPLTMLASKYILEDAQTSEKRSNESRDLHFLRNLDTHNTHTNNIFNSPHLISSTKQSFISP